MDRTIYGSEIISTYRSKATGFRGKIEPVKETWSINPTIQQCSSKNYKKKQKQKT